MELQLPESAYPREFFAELASLEGRHFWFRARDRLFLWAVQRHHPRARRMLEVGCGTGHVLEYLRRHIPSLTIIGTDLFEEGLRHARERTEDCVGLARADARALPFGQVFDVAGAFDVLEHVEQDQLVIDELFRVLRPSGILIISVPQHAWLWSTADEHAHHVRRYTATRLHTLLTSAGFEIIRSTSFVSLLLPAMAASRVVRKRGRTEDPYAELRLPRILNAVLGLVMSVELAAIRLGIRLPAGGSRLVIARRPAVGLF